MNNTNLLSVTCIIIVLGWVFVLPGCSPLEGLQNGDTVAHLSLEAVEGGTVTLAVSTAPAGTFNPLVSESQIDVNVVRPVFETLLKPGKNHVYCEPGLAVDYEFSADGGELIFHLREGVRWHDGEAFTAQDVAFTLHFILDPDYDGLDNSAYLVLEGVEAYRSGDTETISGIEVVDEQTIVLRLAETYGPAFTALASLYVLPEHKFADGTAGSLSEPVGTGPYRFIEYVPDEYLILERNEDWWGGVPRIGRIVWRVVAPDELVELFENGEVDVLGAGAAAVLSPETIQSLSQVAGTESWDRPGFLYDYLLFNLTDERLQEVRLRQAFAYAIDRQALVADVFQGHATLLNGPLLPFCWGHVEEVEPYAHDIDRARELLAAAGWQDNDGDGVVENLAGEPLELVLTYPQGNRFREASVPFIQQDLRAIGVDVQAEGVDYNTLLRRVVQQPDYELGLLGWNLGPDPDQLSIWSPGAVFNFARFEDEKVQELLQEGVRNSLDPQERQPYYEEWFRLMNQKAPYVFLYVRNRSYVVNSVRIRGYSQEALDPLENIAEWWIPPAQQRKGN